jgi:hypothetical protein
MEFAIEMLVKATLRGEKIDEVPITLHPDKRTSHGPHLRTFRDGWRTVRFFLMHSPLWLFLIPGGALMTLGSMGYILALPGYSMFGVRFDAHTLLVSSLAMLLGYQSILFAILAKTFGITEGFFPADPRVTRFFDVLYLERGLLLSAGALLLGLALLGTAVFQWSEVGFGDLDYAQTMRWVVPGVTLSALGFQTLLSSFLVSILGMSRR